MLWLLLALLLIDVYFGTNELIYLTIAQMRAILISPKYATNQKKSAKKVVDLFCR